MKDIFQKGDQKSFRKIVTAADFAEFDTGLVHEVYSTFAMARDAEWGGRLFVLDMLEDGEQGIGTRLEIEHVGPAFMGDEVVITSIWDGISDREIITTFEVTCNDRLVGKGRTGQKIVRSEKLKMRFDEIKQSDLFK